MVREMLNQEDRKTSFFGYLFVFIYLVCLYYLLRFEFNYLIEENEKLESELLVYEKENQLEAYNLTTTKNMYDSIDTLTIHPRTAAENNDMIAFFQNSYELNPDYAALFFKEFSGQIEYYNPSRVIKNPLVKEYQHVFIDKYANDFLVENKETKEKERFTGAIKIVVDYSVDPNKNKIVEIANVSSSMQFNSQYSDLRGALGVPIEFEVITELPSQKVDIKVKQTLGSKGFSDNYWNPVTHEESTIERTITINLPD